MRLKGTGAVDEDEIAWDSSDWIGKEEKEKEGLCIEVVSFTQ